MAVFVLSVPGVALSTVLVDETDFSGFRNTDGNGVFASGNWADTGIDIEWLITDNGSDYTYSYKIRSPDPENVLLPPIPDVTHWILEVSTNFTVDDLLDANFDIDPDSPKEFETSVSNVGIPAGESIFGLEIVTGTTCVEPDDPDAPLPCDLEQSFFEYVFTSTRAPMWGDFYIAGPPPQGAYAYNLGFGMDPTGPDFTNWIPVPDTTNGQVPEPGALLLIAAGLFALTARRY